MQREEFLQTAIQFFPQLKAYIKRRLRVAYLTFEIPEGPSTSDDLLEELVTSAYNQYEEKPKDLSMSEWLYWLANEILEENFHERERETRRWQRHGDHRLKNRPALRERISIEDGEGPWLLETIDELDYHANDFAPPHYEDAAIGTADRKDEVVRITQALSRVPLKERVAFDFFNIEKFPKDTIGRMLAMKPREVPRTAQWVRDRVFQELYQKLYAGQVR